MSNIVQHTKSGGLYNILGVAKLSHFELPWRSGFRITSAVDATNDSEGRFAVLVLKEGWEIGDQVYLFIKNSDNQLGLGEEFVVYRSLDTDKLWFRLKKEFYSINESGEPRFKRKKD